MTHVQLHLRLVGWLNLTVLSSQCLSAILKNIEIKYIYRVFQKTTTDFSSVCPQQQELLNAIFISLISVSASIHAGQFSINGGQTSRCHGCTRKFGERAFSAARPAAWNTLPQDLHHLRAVVDSAKFRKQLTAHYCPAFDVLRLSDHSCMLLMFLTDNCNAPTR